MKTFASSEVYAKVEKMIVGKNKLVVMSTYAPNLVFRYLATVGL